MGDACLPWNVYSGRRLLPDVCGWGVSRIASAVVCSEGDACCYPRLLIKLFVSKLLGLSHTDEA